VGAKAAIEYASSNSLEAEVKKKEVYLQEFLNTHIAEFYKDIEVRGVGMIWGIDLSQAGGPEIARTVAMKCFEESMIIESAGRDDTVVKLLPPLTIETDQLTHGCQILVRSIARVLGRDSAIGQVAAGI
jgi:diaminobutyrate-2-oxoglutarate transaminase